MKKLFRRIFPSREMRRYRKMHHRHRRELIKLAKETREYDWCWLHQMVMLQIKQMHEYYSAGDNVWQTDETRLPIVEELKYVLDMYEEIDRLENDHLGLEWIMEDGNIKFIHPEGYMEKHKEKEDRITELYEEIYSSIGKNLRNWWD